MSGTLNAIRRTDSEQVQIILAQTIRGKNWNED